MANVHLAYIYKQLKQLIAELFRYRPMLLRVTM